MHEHRHMLSRMTQQSRSVSSVQDRCTVNSSFWVLAHNGSSMASHLPAPQLLQQISADLGVHEVHGHHVQHVCPGGHIVEDKAAIRLCKCTQLCASIQG